MVLVNEQNDEKRIGFTAFKAICVIACSLWRIMLDHLSKENDIPLCDKYDDIRRMKLAEPLYPAMISIMAEESGNDSLKNTKK